MTLRSRLFPGDEEQGSSKKDDDLNRNKGNDHQWTFKRPLWMRKGRMLALFGIALTIFLVVFMFSMQAPEIPQDRPQARGGRAKPGTSFMDRAWRQYDPNTPQEAPGSPKRGARPPGVGAGSRTSAGDEDPNSLDFDGPVRFFYLAASLHGIARTDGHKAGNKNVLFAASDLKAAAEIIPLACEMAKWKLNFVHFAFMGRDELALDEIKRLNNAQHKATCDVYWHDARPDYAAFSTDRRMETSVSGALGHIENFMHPQAVVTAAQDVEDDFFTRATARKTKEAHLTHIALPTGELETLTWITRLEAKALHKWHDATIDVLIQAPQETSGSLIRLLKSLSMAHYGGFIPPKLTIELPHQVHTDTMHFINDFTWPPFQYQPHQASNQLTLRRRIPDARMSEDDASMRFVESFYPSHTQDSHVLILSSQAELSPAYYHYLKFHLLEWRYGDMRSDELMGISLETPSAYLNGTDSFEPPKAIRQAKPDEDSTVTSFLWQAPNSNAALIFADKWVEFHSFLTGINLAKRHPRTQEKASQKPKLLSKRFPAWSEHMLELMRARGYFLAFPTPKSDPSQGTSPAIIHNELFQAPEEWFRRASRQTDAKSELKEDQILETPGDYLETHHKSSQEDSLNVERNLLKSLNHILPSAPVVKSNADYVQDPNSLPDPISSLNELTLLDFTGAQRVLDDLITGSDLHAIGFRSDIGGCDERRAAPESITIGQADDLFCLEDFDHESAATVDKPAVAKPDTPAGQPVYGQKPVGPDARKKSTEDHPKDHVAHAAEGPPAPKGKPNLPKQGDPRIPGAGVAADAANAVADAGRSEETAIAALNDKLAKSGGKAAGKDAVASPGAPGRPESNVAAMNDRLEKIAEAAGLSPKDSKMSDLQRSEVEDWKAKQRKEGGEIANEPVRANPAPRKAANAADVEDEDILGATPGAQPVSDRESKLQEGDVVDAKAAAKKVDPDDKRPAGQKPAKEEAVQDAAGRKTPTKGRLRGYDQGGFAEDVRDERAAAAGKVPEGERKADRGPAAALPNREA